MTNASMKKLLLTGLTLVLVIAGATVALGVVGDHASSPAGMTTTTTGEDVSGPCDEAEHANDPRCTGGQRADDHGDRGRDHAEDDGRADDDADDEAGEDISGPCDEAEHANDPRCTGAPSAPGTDLDNSGPGSLNSGPGNAGDVDDDSRGPGPGGDDDGGSSGPGGGDDDSSGPGSGDDD
jgi:hypothetical protein